MTNAVPEVEALGKVINALEPLQDDKRAQVLRWAAEHWKVRPWHPGDHFSSSSNFEGQVDDRLAVAAERVPPSPTGPTDIKSFVTEKQPGSDVQFAAVAAYHLKFLAPDRRETITAKELENACRLAQRRIPPNANQTLINAKNLGYLDLVGKGEFTLNSVGENLVALALPAAQGTASRTRKAAARKKKGSTKKMRGKAVLRKAKA